MNARFLRICWFAAMIAVGAAGIAQIIDQPSMIALTAALVAIGGTGRCWRRVAA